MIAYIILSVFIGVAIGLGICCVREIRGLNELIDMYESHVCDLIDEVQRYRGYRDEGNND